MVDHDLQAAPGGAEAGDPRYRQGLKDRAGWRATRHDYDHARVAAVLATHYLRGSEGEISSVDRAKLNLSNVRTRGEFELIDGMRDTEFERMIRGEVDLPEAARVKQVVRDGAPFSQDAVHAILFRQGAF